MKLSIHLSADERRALAALSDETRVPQSALIRIALDRLLAARRRGLRLGVEIALPRPHEDGPHPSPLGRPPAPEVEAAAGAGVVEWDRDSIAVVRRSA